MYHINPFYNPLVENFILQANYFYRIRLVPINSQVRLHILIKIYSIFFFFNNKYIFFSSLDKLLVTENPVKKLNLLSKPGNDESKPWQHYCHNGIKIAID